MTRLCVLMVGVPEGVATGVFFVGVLEDELGVDWLLSLLRERLDELGEIGSLSSMFGSARMKTPLSFALRRRARSLCSLKKLLLNSSVSEPGREEEEQESSETEWWRPRADGGVQGLEMIGSTVNALAGTCATILETVSSQIRW
jgi:hypothetical protein